MAESAAMTGDSVTIASIAMLVAGLGTMAWIDFKTGYLPDTLQIALTAGAVVILALGSPIGIGWIAAATGATSTFNSQAT